MRFWVSAFVGLALSFNVVAGTTVLDKSEDEQSRVLRGIQQDMPFTPRSGIARKAVTNLGHVMERYKNKQQGSLETDNHDFFSMRLLSEVKANMKPEELALVDDLATAIEQADAQAFDENMAAVRLLLKDRIALMHQSVLEIHELKDTLKMFDSNHKLEFRLVENEDGESTVAIHIVEVDNVKDATSDVVADEVSDVAVADEVKQAANNDEMKEIANDEVEPDEGRFGDDKKKEPTPSPTRSPSPVAGPPTKGTFPEVDPVELVTFLLFILGFPSCVIFAGLGQCIMFATLLFFCEVLVDPPEVKEEMCEDFNEDNDNKVGLPSP